MRGIYIAVALAMLAGGASAADLNDLRSFKADAGKVEVPAVPAPAKGADIKRYAFDLQGRLYSWSHVLSQPAILSGTFEVALTDTRAPRIQNIQADLKLLPSDGLNEYDLNLSPQDDKSCGYVKDIAASGDTLFNIKAPALITADAANTVLGETLTRLSDGTVPSVPAALSFGFYCAQDNPGACTAAKWSRIGFRSSGSGWVGDNAADGMRFDIKTSSLVPLTK